MGIAFHEQAVLVGARLALVAVDDQIVGMLSRRQEAPFDAGGEACAAPAQQDGSSDLFVDLRRLLLKRGAQRLVTSGGLITLQRVGVRVLESLRDDLGAAVVDVSGSVRDVAVSDVSRGVRAVTVVDASRHMRDVTVK